MCPEEMRKRRHFDADFEKSSFIFFARAVFFAEQAFDEEEVLEVLEPDDKFAVDFSAGDLWVVDILGMID